MKKQTLKQRTKRNTPTNTSLVRGNCDLQLNKEETLSVANSKTCFNNPEVNQSQHTGNFKSVVYVISIDGKPLMPCTPAKAKKLLKSNRAKVVRLYPFTIKLNFVCENQVQEVKLGIDSGYQNIGFSAITEKKELLSGTVILDDKTSLRLHERKMYRRLRRSKLRYRKPRFLNRGNKKEGWLAPSIQRRYDTHLKVIDLAKSILPISEVIIEAGNFDIQKIENPNISGIEYQQGDMYGYQNMRSYLMAREKGLCQLCKKEFTKGNPAHIHHCKERRNKGSNRAKNMAILHKKCHEKLHRKNLKLSTPKEFTAESFMSIIRNRLKKDIPDAKLTFGYKTFVDRNKLRIEKAHYNDAFVIANGTIQTRILPIEIQQKHRNNRVLQLNRKGFAPSIRRKRYDIQPKDIIWINGVKYSVRGIHTYGKQVTIQNYKKTLSVKNIEKKYHFGSFTHQP